MVVPRQTLRNLVDGLGEVDVILSQTYKQPTKLKVTKLSCRLVARA